MKYLRAFVLTVSIALITVSALAQHDMPPGITHEQHLALMKKQAEMKQRGNAAMGFEQDKTTHHFFLTPGGGAIQVEANSEADTTSRDQIRAHLKKISVEFANGDFRAPVATHSEMPPGAQTMQRLKNKIAYSYRERPRGAAVRIESSDDIAVTAIHDFLRYQIKEHATGDPLTVGDNTE
jgi:hypothetical protein